MDVLEGSTIACQSNLSVEVLQMLQVFDEDIGVNDKPQSIITICTPT